MWWFVALAFVVCAGAAFLLGQWWAERKSGPLLLQARSDVRRTQALQRLHTWDTDREHRLRNWRAPGLPIRNPEEPAPHAEAGKALFGGQNLVAAEALRSHLRAERPFAGLRVRTGEIDWLIDGAPRVDELGQFIGFAGQASPEVQQEELGLGANTLRQLLEAMPGPALLAVQQPDHWAVKATNAVASVQWPDWTEGTSLSPGFARLPVSLVSGLHIVPPGQVIEASGWKLARFRSEHGRHVALIAKVSALGTDDEAAAIGRLAHDLRKPLRAVQSYARSAQEELGAAGPNNPIAPSALAHLERVQASAQRLHTMLDALALMERLGAQPLVRQPVNLSELAQFVVEDLRRLPPERKVQVSIEPGVHANADPHLVRLVMEHLLGNAWKFTLRAPEARIAFRQVTHAGRPGFAIIDNGAGFEPQLAEHLFSLFSTLHPAAQFPGLGTGLAQVKRIVQRHGGHVWASGQPEGGATFTFTLG